MQRVIRVVLGLVVTASLAACSDDDNEKDPVDSTTTTSTAAPETTAGGTTTVTGMVAVALGRYPAVADDTIQVTVVDLAKVRSLNGAARVDVAADMSATRADILSLVPRPEAPGAKAAADLPTPAQRGTQASYADFRKTFGWSLPEVRAFVDAGPRNPALLLGAFQESAFTAALGAPANGVWARGESGKPDLSKTSPANPTGNAVRIALVDGALIHATTDAGVAAGVAAANRTGPTLAQDETIASMAAALDKQDVYGAVLARRPSFTAKPPSGQRADVKVLSSRFTAFATSGDVDEGGPVLVVVLAHADDATAEANAASLRDVIATSTSEADGKSLAERFQVIEIKTEGKLVVARLRPLGTRLSVWAELAGRGEAFLSHK